MQHCVRKLYLKYRKIFGSSNISVILLYICLSVCLSLSLLYINGGRCIALGAEVIIVKQQWVYNVSANSLLQVY